MATNFQRNGCMVSRGAEKFDIPNLTNSNSGDTFDTLIKRADNEISNRFLDGTGLTDENGFVGCVEVKYE
ncbi:phage portal protein family protein, partial [Ornithobacterium rhinotracheale]